jgi:uncharacterized integral membrane protein
MRFLSSLITLALTIVVAVFSVANRGPVTVNLWPFDVALDMPVFLLAFGALAIGLLVGAFLLWAPLMVWRRAGRKRLRRIAALEAELAARPPLAASGDAAQILLPPA